MKDFDNSFLAVLSSEEAVAFWLVDMQISTGVHQYFTTLDIDIVIDGNRYISTDMSIDPVNYSVGMSVDKMRLEFENVSLTMSATLLNNNVTGQPMIIYGGAMPKNIYSLPPDTNLEGYWALDDNTGTNAEDSSGNGNDGTITGTSWVSGVSGSSLSFSSGSDIVSFSEVTLPHGSWSISYWMVEDASGKMTIGTNGEDPNRLRHVNSTDAASYLKIDMNDGGGLNLYFGEIMQDTGWRHIVVTADGDTISLYLDGNLVDSDTELTNEFRVDCIGNPYTTTTYTWEGELDEVRLYTETLSANEIKALYLNPGGSRQPLTEIVFRGLTSDWSLDEKKAEISVVDEFVYWNKRSLRKPDALCPWEFKGTECGYSGSSVLCNKTYSRCFGFGNTDNSGGFRFFPAMEEREVWWGKQS